MPMNLGSKLGEGSIFPWNTPSNLGGGSEYLEITPKNQWNQGWERWTLVFFEFFEKKREDKYPYIELGLVGVNKVLNWYVWVVLGSLHQQQLVLSYFLQLNQTVCYKTLPTTLICVSGIRFGRSLHVGISKSHQTRQFVGVTQGGVVVLVVVEVCSLYGDSYCYLLLR